MKKKKKITILGSTGSIGTQALEVIDGLNGGFEVLSLSAGDNIELLKNQIIKYKPKKVCVKTLKAAELLRGVFAGVEFVFGEEGLLELCQDRQNDFILVAVTGKIGLRPTLAAIENGINIALANKETLVMAGEIVMKAAWTHNAQILPVDSEHSAIHQCLANKHNLQSINKLIITASGGPFREAGLYDIKNATVQQTLAHPKWNMGKKITIDSATLMNKGLEVIEAHHLFGISYDKIVVVVHPQSIIHSAVEYLDGSVLAQLGLPSMHIPIQYALTYPDRIKGIKTESLDFIKIARLDFEQPDNEKFPCLNLAFEAGKTGGLAPVVLNAANEEAVFAFLDDKIKLFDIYKIVEKSLSDFLNIKEPSLEDILECDSQTRKKTIELIARI